MDSNLLHVVVMFKANGDIVTKAFTDISPEHWFRAPGDDSNHLMWEAGHVIWSRGNIVKLLGQEWSTSWTSLFARGAAPPSREQLPGVDEVRSTWQELSGKLLTSLDGAPPDLLAKPAPQGPPTFDGKISGVIAFLAFHETYHVGQISYLRKWLGYGQSVGYRKRSL